VDWFDGNMHEKSIHGYGRFQIADFAKNFFDRIFGQAPQHAYTCIN
jgi:hypothetical protein